MLASLVMVAREPRSLEAVRWQCFVVPEHPSVIVVVVDDSDDDWLAGVFAIEQVVPSPRFSGNWHAAEGHDPTISFELLELAGGEHGVRRRFIVEAVGQGLIETIRRVPHYVAIVPAEIAGDAVGAQLLPRLAAALFVQVEHRSPSIEALRAPGAD